MKILKLSDVVKLELLKLSCKLTHDIQPTPLKDMFDQFKGKKTHKYMTRNKGTPNIQAQTSVIFNRVFMYKGLSQCMVLSSDLKSKASLKALRKF